MSQYAEAMGLEGVELTDVPKIDFTRSKKIKPTQMRVSRDKKPRGKGTKNRKRHTKRRR